MYGFTRSLPFTHAQHTGVNHTADSSSFRNGKTHCDVEIDAALVFVIADENRLHPNIGDVDGAREEEEDGQTGQ